MNPSAESTHTVGHVSEASSAILATHAFARASSDHSNTRSYRRHYLARSSLLAVAHSHVRRPVVADADTLLLAAFSLSRTLARPATAA